MNQSPLGSCGFCGFTICQGPSHGQLNFWHRPILFERSYYHTKSPTRYSFSLASSAIAHVFKLSQRRLKCLLMSFSTSSQTRSASIQLPELVLLQDQRGVSFLDHARENRLKWDSQILLTLHTFRASTFHVCRHSRPEISIFHPVQSFLLWKDYLPLAFNFVCVVNCPISQTAAGHNNHKVWATHVLRSSQKMLGVSFPVQCTPSAERCQSKPALGSLRSPIATSRTFFTVSAGTRLDALALMKNVYARKSLMPLSELDDL